MIDEAPGKEEERNRGLPMTSISDSSNNISMNAGPGVMPCACRIATPAEMAFWIEVGDATIALAEQHAYTWALLSDLLPKKLSGRMRTGDRIVTSLRSNLESVMYASGIHDPDRFYPARPPEKRYLLRPGRQPPLTEEEWREIGEELEKCLSGADALSKLLSGMVRAPILDAVTKYRSAILRAKMQLEPIALKQIGQWGILYPREATTS